MIVIGVDPGVTGAIVSYDSNGNLKLMPIPLINFKLIKKEIDWGFLKQYIESSFMDWSFNDARIPVPSPNTHVFIEQTWSHRGQGISSTYKFGYNSGILHGLFLALGFPITYVSPQRWKKEMGLIGKDKKDSVVKAENLFPKYKSWFRGPKGGIKDGLAEAALIAKYGYDVISEGS